MRKSLASGVGVAAALMFVFGASASANPYDPYAGQKYADVAATISGYGGTAVIATRVGEYLPTEQCIVSGSRRSNGKWLLDLNCNDTYAGKSGHSGNSAVSPDGQKALAVRAQATNISNDFANNTAKGATPYCARGDHEAQNCVKICNEAGTCSAELLQALGL